MPLNPVVYAQLVKLRADSELRLERLLAKERAMPNMIANHSSRLSTGKQIREARDQASSWKAVVHMALLEADDIGVDERSVPGA